MVGGAAVRRKAGVTGIVGGGGREGGREGHGGRILVGGMVDLALGWFTFVGRLLSQFSSCSLT